MHLLVFGANGPTGRRVVSQALAAGHHVAAVTRRPHEYPLTSPDLDVLDADVTDPAGVDEVMANRPDAVISTYGVPYSRKPITVYSAGARAILDAMGAHDVRRLVCVTSTTVANEDAEGDTLVWRKIVTPLLRRVLGRTLYDDMERMETLVRASAVDWTIVRPAGLFDTDEPTVDHEVSTRRLVGRVTSRADLAATLLREAVAPQHPRKTIEVITRTGTPGLRNFVTEAFGGGATSVGSSR